MRETGKIIETDGHTAVVQLAKGEKCGDCKACDAFGNRNATTITAINSIHARPGDVVDINIAPSTVIWHTFLIFILPIAMLIIGYIAAQRITGNNQNELFGIIGAVAGFVLSLIVLKLFDKRFADVKQTAAHIVAWNRIHDHSHDDCSLL